jgi:hypothetical protein
MVDQSRNELMMLSTHGDDNQLSVNRLPIGKNIVTAVPSRDRDKLFVLTSGEERRLNESDEKPQLFVVSGGLQPKVEQAYELTARLQKLALDPEGEWAVVHEAGGVVVNVNELILVNLAKPGSEPISKTIRSTGGAPQRFTFTPPLTLPSGAQHRLLVVETSLTLAAISSCGAATSISPISVSFRDGSPGKPTPSRLRTVLRPPSQPTR